MTPSDLLISDIQLGRVGNKIVWNLVCLCRCGRPTLYIGHLRPVWGDLRCQHTGAECAVVHLQELRGPALPPGLLGKGEYTRTVAASAGTGHAMQDHTSLGDTQSLEAPHHGEHLVLGSTMTPSVCLAWPYYLLQQSSRQSWQQASSSPNVCALYASAHSSAHAVAVTHQARAPAMPCRVLCPCSTSRAYGWSAIARLASSAPGAVARAPSTLGPAPAR